MALLLKNLLFTVLIPGTVAVFIPLYAFAHPPPTRGALALVAVPLLLLGASIYAWCVWDFASVGRGTPAPIDPPKTLVVRGLYRYVRNPMYVGVLSVIAGWAVLFTSVTLLAYLIAVAVTFHLFVLLYEEPRLTKLFGASYESYRREVGRWWPKGRAAI